MLLELIILANPILGGVSMNQRWTLHVENFGKVKEADIEISPLMLFVGDNNSGKSYLMSLLWGILTTGGILFYSNSHKKYHLNNQAYKKCESWLEENLDQDVEISNDVEKLFIEWFNKIIEKEKGRLTEIIFHYPVKIGNLYIENYTRKIPLKINWLNGDEIVKKEKNRLKLPKPNSSEEKYSTLVNICWKLLMSGIAGPTIKPLMRGGKRAGEPVYLPASRTGFMLAKESLLNAAISKFSKVSHLEQDSVFTLPYTDFLQTIIQFDTAGGGSYKEIVSFIGEHILYGDLSARKETVPIIRYHPDGMDKGLPLHISSSVVAELSPLVLLLKSGIKFNLLIIEEPEAHLHPQLQWLIARVLIKLVNAGLPVWVTTHSDTILQHINNMIKLHNHKNKAGLQEMFKYQKDDLINEDKVTMYQFDMGEGQKTIIRRLQSEKYGFAVPSFNNTLVRLLEETQTFQGDDYDV